MLSLFLALALAQATNGAALFDNHCASCHAGTDARVPSVAALRQRTPDAIVAALVSGVMRQQGAELSDAERRAVAEFLSAASRAEARPDIGRAKAGCAAPPPLNLSNGPRWNGWGADLSNTRFQPAAQRRPHRRATSEADPEVGVRFSQRDVRARPADDCRRTSVRRQSERPRLRPRRGERLHHLDVPGAGGGAIGHHHRPRGSGSAAYFGDGKANAYTIDAETGALLWTRNLDEHGAHA